MFDFLGKITYNFVYLLPDPPQIQFVKVPFCQNLGRDQDKSLTFDGQKLTGQKAGNVGCVIWPFDVLRIRQREHGRPASKVNLNYLRVFVISQEKLQMLPTVEASNFAEWSIHNALQRVRLAISLDRPFEVRGFDFATMMDNLFFGRDE